MHTRVVVWTVLVVALLGITVGCVVRICGGKGSFTRDTVTYLLLGTTPGFVAMLTMGFPLWMFFVMLGVFNLFAHIGAWLGKKAKQKHRDWQRNWDAGFR